MDDFAKPAADTLDALIAAQVQWVDNLDEESRYECLKEIATYVARYNVPGVAFTPDDLAQIIFGLLDIIDQWGTLGQVAPADHVRKLFKGLNDG